MAKIRTMTEDWEKWVASRPPNIQEMIKRHPFDRLYLLEPSNHRVEIVSYCGDGTLVVAVLGKWNYVTFERNVFGINPDDLVECDLPSEDEELGVMLSQTEAKDYIKVMKEEYEAEEDK